MATETSERSLEDRVRALVGDDKAKEVMAQLAEERQAAVIGLLDHYEASLVRLGQTLEQAEGKAIEHAPLIGLMVGFVQQTIAVVGMEMGERASAAAKRTDDLVDSLINGLTPTGEG